MVGRRGIILCGIILLSRLANLWGQERPVDENPSLTFVQLTDAHVFDDGYEEAMDDRFKIVGHDWTSLHWAIGRINELVNRGEPIDFVVYTGDLGLQNVDLKPPQKTAVITKGEPSVSAEPPECERLLAAELDFKSVPPIPREWAVEQVARELNTLAVSKLYFVPGNNDLIQEMVEDAPRHSCFIKLLQTRLNSLSTPSPLTVEELKVGSPVSLKNFRLIGLNTASFKAAKNYRGCNGQVKEGCPTKEIASLQKQVNAKSDEPILVFTHVPNLKDPYRGGDSWVIAPDTRNIWNQLACNSKLLAVFAGHFHSSDRNIYGTAIGTHNLSVDPCVTEKTWVAPPLAIKKQFDKQQTAQGLVLAKVFRTGKPKVEVQWFGEPLRSKPIRRKCEFPVIAGLVLFLSLILFVFFVLIKRGSTI